MQGGGIWTAEGSGKEHTMVAHSAASRRAPAKLISASVPRFKASQPTSAVQLARTFLLPLREHSSSCRCEVRSATAANRFSMEPDAATTEKRASASESTLPTCRRRERLALFEVLQAARTLASVDFVVAHVYQLVAPVHGARELDKRDVCVVEPFRSRADLDKIVVLWPVDHARTPT